VAPAANNPYAVPRLLSAFSSRTADVGGTVGVICFTRAAGLNGASVFRGVGGFGASCTIHKTRLFSLVNEQSIEIVIHDGA